MTQFESVLLDVRNCDCVVKDGIFVCPSLDIYSLRSRPSSQVSCKLYLNYQPYFSMFAWRTIWYDDIYCSPQKLLVNTEVTTSYTELQDEHSITSWLCTWGYSHKTLLQWNRQTETGIINILLIFPDIPYYGNISVCLINYNSFLDCSGLQEVQLSLQESSQQGMCNDHQKL